MNKNSTLEGSKLTMDVSKVRSVGSDKMPVDTDLSKSQTYLLIEEMMEKNIIVKQERLGTFVELLNRDLVRQENVLRILKIFKIIFTKIRAGMLPEFPLLSDTLISIIDILWMVKNNEINNSERDKIFNICSEILANLSGKMFLLFSCDSFPSMYKLIKAFSSPSDCGLRLQVLVLQFVQNYILHLSNSQKTEFVNNGTDVWFSSLMPFVFQNENQCRKLGIDIFEMILPDLISHKYFNHPQWPGLLKNVKDREKYPKIILQLLSKDDPSWSNLWILVIKIMGVELHKIGGSINPLLYVLQEAFKKNVECKSQAFVCLKELINNFALDPDLLTHNNRVKVLSTALESNNAKTEQIGLLKFNIWWHLITVLEQNAKSNVQMVITPFLEFCYGSAKNINTKGNKTYPGEVFPSVQKLAIKSFVEICGHAQCAGCTNNSITRLGGPVLDWELMEKFYTNLIYSLKTVTIFVNTHLFKSDKKLFEELIQNLKCIWKSFVKVSAKLKNPHVFGTVMRNIFNLLTFFVQSHSKEPLFAEIIITLIIPAIVDKSNGYMATSLNDSNLKISHSSTPIQALISVILLPELYHAETMSKIHFDYDRYVEVGIIGGLKEFCVWLLSVLKRANHGPLFWCSLANVLSTCQNPIPIDTLMAILRWPIKHNLDENKILKVSKSWKKLFELPKARIINSNGKSILKHENDLLAVMIKVSNNERNSNILIQLLLPMFIKKLAKERPGSTIINSSLLDYESIVTKLNAGQLSCYEKVGLCYSLNELSSICVICRTNSTSSSDETIISIMKNTINILNTSFTSSKDPICQGLEEIDYINRLLEALHGFVSASFCQGILTSVIDLLFTMVKNVKNPIIENKCFEILQKINHSDGTNIKLETSDSVKIQQALNTQNKNKKHSLDVIPMPKISPISKPDSKKSTKLQTKTSDDFVIVKTAWKFDPKNLTEHQKEALKRRRDDIPALYEDLSQSQDESMMKSWKPPGYNSDSQGDSSKSENAKITISNNTKLSVSLSNLNCVPLKCKKVEENKTDGRIVLRLSKIGDAIKSPELIKQKKYESGKVELNKKPENSCESTILNENADIENMESKSPMNTPGRKRKSILTRINDNLKNLKNISSNNETLTPIKNEDLLDNCISEDIITANDLKSSDKSELSENVIENTQNEEVENNTPAKRPNRIRRKPCKLLVNAEVDKKKITKNSDTDSTSSESYSQNVTNDETVLSIKKTRSNSLKNSQIIEESQSQSLIPEEIIPKRKRRSRLLSQLEIDTKEGHPLIGLTDVGKNGRISRRSTLNSESGKNSIIKSSIKEKGKNKFISTKSQSIQNENAENECTSNSSKSIHSQETQIFVPPDKISADDITGRTLSNESLDIGPDFIESSQEDTLSLKTAISKSKESSMTDDNKISNSTTVHKEDVSLNSQDIAEAETEPFISANETTLNTTPNEICYPQENCNKSVNESSIPSSAEADTQPINFNDMTNLDDKPNTEIGDSESIKNDKNTPNLESPSKPVLNDELLMNVSIISSPCQDDLKERTMEFLNDTVDISPIKRGTASKTSPENKDFDGTNIVSDIQSPIKVNKPALVTSPDLFTNEKNSPTKEGEAKSVPEKIIPLAPIFNAGSLKNMTSFGSRTAQMLSLCMNNESLQNGIQDKKEMSSQKTIPCENINTDQSEKPMLEFSKSIPCSTASPIGPILKRKIELDELTISPSSKRKRVSFHDPPVSTTVSVEKYIAPRGIKSPQIRILYGEKNDQVSQKPSRPLVAKCLMNSITMQAKLEQQEQTNESTPVDVANNAPDSQLSEAFSLIVDSPQPLNIITNYLLNDCDPIYPSLVNCNDSLSKISSYLSSPLWKNDFIEEIKEKISTIGDLAKLTELEVNRLPFKSPKLETVMKVLSDYENRLSKIEEKEDTMVESAIFEGDDKIETKGDSILGDIKLTGVFIDEYPEDKAETREMEDISSNQPSAHLGLNTIDELSNTLQVEEVKNVTDCNMTTETEEQLLQEIAKPEERITKPENSIDSNRDDDLEKIVEKFTHKVILDSISPHLLVEYVSEKMKREEEFCSSITTALNKITNCDIISKSSQLKLFCSQLSKISGDFANVMNSLEKLPDE